MKQQNQSGFAQLMIITIILGLGLVGTLGFVFYQNFIQKKDNVSKNDNSSKLAEKDSESTGIEDVKDIADLNKGYLVLDDWGVKFKLPAALGNKEITYYKGIPTKGTSYLFTTKGVEALGDTCAYNSNSYWGPLGTVTKSTTSPQEDEAVQGYTGALITQFDGNYYYYFSPQSTCSNKSTDLQVQDVALVKELIMSLQKK